MSWYIDRQMPIEFCKCDLLGNPGCGRCECRYSCVSLSPPSFCQRRLGPGALAGRPSRGLQAFINTKERWNIDGLVFVVALCVVAVTIIAAGCNWQHGGEHTSLKPSVHAQSAQEIAKEAFNSTVLLIMQDANGQPLSLGSGFFVCPVPEMFMAGR